MAEERSRGRGCLKFGCVGCAVLVGVPLIVILALTGANLVTRTAPDQREESFSYEIAHAPGATPPGSAGEPDRDPLPEGALPPPPGAGVGTIELDVRYAELIVVPGRPGEPIRVEADYDVAKFELAQSFAERDGGDWTYRLEFGLRRSLWLSMFGTSSNRVRLIVPPDVPFRVRGEVRMGAGEMEFGGLAVRSIDLECRMGGVVLAFSDPLPEPMERLALSGRMGGGEIDGLGNASPHLVTIHQRMGGLELDLHGVWRNDAEIRLDFGMGGASVLSPDGANLVVGERSLSMGEIQVADLGDVDPALPTITVHVHGRMGGVDIR